MSRRTFKWTTKLFFHLLDLTIFNSWILLSSCGAKYTHRDFRLLLVRNLIEEAGKSQDHPTPRLVGRQNVRAKKCCDSRVAITNIGQRNHQPNCATVCVLLAAKKRAQSIGAPDVMWACAWCLVSQNITQMQICKSPSMNTVCCDKAVIQDAIDLLQQPELCQ